MRSLIAEKIVNGELISLWRSDKSPKRLSIKKGNKFYKITLKEWNGLKS